MSRCTQQYYSVPGSLRALIGFTLGPLGEKWVIGNDELVIPVPGKQTIIMNSERPALEETTSWFESLL